MPYTRRQVRFLESSGSPLTAAQKDKMNSELRSNPSLGHNKKGSEAMKKEAPKESPNMMSGMRIDIHRGTDNKVTGHTVHHEFAAKSSKSGAFMERPESATHMFGPKGEKVGDGMEMMPHLKQHLGLGSPARLEGKEADPGIDEEEEETQEGT